MVCIAYLDTWYKVLSSKSKSGDIKNCIVCISGKIVICLNEVVVYVKEIVG